MKAGWPQRPLCCVGESQALTFPGVLGWSAQLDASLGRLSSAHTVKFKVTFCKKLSSWLDLPMQPGKPLGWPVPHAGKLGQELCKPHGWGSAGNFCWDNTAWELQGKHQTISH